MFDNLSTMPTNKIKSTSNDNGLSSQQFQIQSAQQHRDASRVEEANTDAQSGQDNLTDGSRGDSLQASDRKALMATVKNLNDKLENQELQARFSVDDESGQFVVSITDSNTGKVVRQIPSEESLEFARNAEKGVGILVNKSY